PRPRLDHLLRARRILRLDLLHEGRQHERALLYASRPRRSPGLLRWLAALPAADDHPLRRLLLVARLHAFLFAPRADDVASAARTTTVRVIHRIHDFAANLRALSHPPALTRLAPRLQLVLGVTDFAD